MSDGANLGEAMNRLWTKFLPQIEERVSILRDSAAKVTSGSLSPEQQQQACADAHKLAGVLGTFGLQQGTELARQAESLYGGALEMDQATGSRLATIAAELAAVIASRQ